jgi:hypothetical protein
MSKSVRLSCTSQVHMAFSDVDRCREEETRGAKIHRIFVGLEEREVIFGLNEPLRAARRRPTSEIDRPPVPALEADFLGFQG